MKATSNKELKNTEFNRARVVCRRKIRPQFPSSNEGQLMFAIFSGAVTDLFSRYPNMRHDSARYLLGSIVHAEICGVDADWVRTQFKLADVDIKGKLRGPK